MNKQRLRYLGFWREFRPGINMCPKLKKKKKSVFAQKK